MDTIIAGKEGKKTSMKEIISDYFRANHAKQILIILIVGISVTAITITLTKAFTNSDLTSFYETIIQLAAAISIILLSSSVYSKTIKMNGLAKKMDGLIDNMTDYVMNMEKKKTKEKLDNVLFDEVIIKEGKNVYKQYLFEKSGDADFYYELAKMQYDRATKLSAQKKYNDALNVLELSKRLFRVALSIDNKRSKENMKNGMYNVYVKSSENPEESSTINSDIDKLFHVFLEKSIKETEEKRENN